MNFSKPKAMVITIFINGKFLSSPMTGVQRYAFELFRRMDLILTEPEYQNLRMVCLTPPDVTVFPEWKNIEVRRVGLFTGNMWEQIDLPASTRGKFLFSPANSGPFFYTNQAVTIHDASVFAVPEAYTRTFRAKYIQTFKKLVRSTKLILTNSCFSQRELSHFLGSPTSRFSVVLEGGDHLNETLSDSAVLQRCGLSKNAYIFSVANQSNHKNLARILQVAEQMDNQIQFVVAGGVYAKVFQPSAHQPVSKNVHFLGYVNDSELKALYENALAFIFPSTYEGFGLPLLEAMNCNCPVLCSNAAAIPEVAGQAALYFDPNDVDEISALIKKLLVDPDLQADLKYRGRTHAPNFTWEKTARKTLTELLACLPKGGL
jgi:glycosyltransferase involved in cell wall biosynthesis